MAVTWSKKAQGCLDEIIYYIALDNPERAFSFRDELLEVAERIADFPFANPLRIIGSEQVRVKVYKTYKISYQIDSDDIIIVYVHKDNIPRL